MTHAVRLSEETYQALKLMADRGGRSVPKQIEYIVKKLSELVKQQNLAEFVSKEAYRESLKQAEPGTTIKIGEHSGMEDLLEKLGI